MPSLLLAPPKMLRKTGLWLLARQKIETPVNTGKIPTKGALSVLGSTEGASSRTLWNNLPLVNRGINICTQWLNLNVRALTL